MTSTSIASSAIDTTAPVRSSPTGKRPLSRVSERSVSRAALWTGRIMSSFVSAFLLLDAVVKLVQAAPAVKGTVELGYAPSVLVPLGIVLLASLALYVIPRTAVLGAVVLTGYLGGAIATHVRVGAPLASHVLFPVYVAVLIWGGLYLRDPRARTLIGPRV